MLFNSTLREEPYLGLTSHWPSWKQDFPFGDMKTDGAWLSSARVVRCLVKSNNERNPRLKLLTLSWALLRYCQCKLEEGEDDVKSSCLLRLGLQACYNGRYNEKQYGDVKQNSKSRSQFGLESATRLHEVGIASNPESECRGEYVPGCCTHRPSRHGSR